MTTSIPLRLALLGGFQLQKGDREIVIAASGQRLVALLALHHRPLTRLRAAGTLWPEFSPASLIRLLSGWGRSTWTR